MEITMIKQFLAVLLLHLVVVGINGQFKSYIQQVTPDFSFSVNIQPHSWLSSFFRPSQPLTDGGDVRNDDIEPEIDMNPNRCGVQVTHCPESKYRSHDGSCNNKQYPSWGTPNSTYQRLLPVRYLDGIHTPLDMYPNTIPLPRKISFTMNPELPIDDPIWTLNTMQYGQYLTHDMALAAGSQQTTKHGIRCCTDEGKLFPRNFKAPVSCYSIVIPPDDPVYTPEGIECLTFTRTSTDRDRQCPYANGPAEQINAVTAYIDNHPIYGNSDEENAGLRQFSGGLLRVQYFHNKPFLSNVEQPETVCDVKPGEDPSTQVCFRAGDGRVNQNPQLALLHVLWMREHNRIASILGHLNPHWSDETIYQEARRICIAEHQYISYYEWLPIIVGWDQLIEHRVINDTDGYWDAYKPHICPNIINEFSTAAFRYFHTAIQGLLEIIHEDRVSKDKTNLSKWFDRPDLTVPYCDALLRGLSTQPEEQVDQFITEEVTNKLFKPINNRTKLGADLRATDIQRGRDHGLGSYNDARELIGMKRAYHFDDFKDILATPTVEQLKQLYSDPDKVDLIVGGFMEPHTPGSLTGPTFKTIIIEQFYRTRHSDRWWFEENEASPYPFTPAQLKAIKNTSISRLICDNGDNIHEMQPKGFERISPSNPLVHCDELPFVDLSLWKDSNGPTSIKSDSSGSIFDFSLFK